MEKTKTWETDDGAVQFIFTYEIGTSSCSEVKVVIFSPAEPDNRKELTLHGESKPVSIGFKMKSGTGIEGDLSLKSMSDVNCVRCVWGEFTYYVNNHAEQIYEGCMIEVSTGGHRPPSPPTPPDPDPIAPPNPYRCEPSPTVYLDNQASAEDDLFPYVYMRFWPKLDDGVLLLNYVQYPLVDSASSDAFIKELEKYSASGDADARLKMLALAQSYIEGDDPYQGLYLQNIDSLPGVMPQFPALLEYVRHDLDITIDKLNLYIKNKLGLTPDQLKTFLSSDEFDSAVQQVWASYFSLVIIMGYDATNLVVLSKELQACHLLLQCYVSDDQEQEPVTTSEIQQLAHARILLPNTIFPLPPVPPKEEVERPHKGAIEPYAIGDLQMLRQRFSHYQLGDIAHIENIMAGEKRLVRSKVLSQQAQETAQEEVEEDFSGTVTEYQEKKQLHELRRSIAERTVTDDYKDLKTTYGQPTEATISGTVIHTTKAGEKPEGRDKIKFARDILDKSVREISSQVKSYRSINAFDENERAHQSEFDNTANSRNRVGIYRWLNRVYSAYVVNYGTRLMIEFIVNNPAERFIEMERSQFGIELVRPLTLQQKGITNYSDITESNYLELSVYYKVKEVSTYPQKKIVVSVSLYGGEKVIQSIPEGYQVTAVTMESTVAKINGDDSYVLAGAHKIKTGETVTGLDKFGEENTLSIVAPMPGFSSPALDDSSTLPLDNSYAVSITISCEPSAEVITNWQIATYNALAEGYSREIKQYYRLADEYEGKYQRSPQVNRGIERKVLKQDCMRLLLKRHVDDVGLITNEADKEDKQPSQFYVNQPRYLQFFEEAYEWREMSYSFYSGINSLQSGIFNYTSGSAQADPLFKNFLEADVARILVPVRPDKAMAAIYYLASGVIWFGDERYVAVNPDDAALAYEYKKARLLTDHDAPVVGESWDVTVPTTMQIIDQDSSSIKDLEGHS